MSTDGEPISTSESRADQVFRRKIDRIRSWNEFSDMPAIEGNEIVAGQTISGILEAYGHGRGLEQDWRSNITDLNPAVLDLGCGSDYDDQDTLLQWFPYVPVILGTHGADPKRIVGVDLMPFKYAEGIYTHLTADIVSLVKSGKLVEFLKPHTPEGKFDAIVMNNLDDSPEMHEALRRNALDVLSFNTELRKQFPQLLRPDGAIVYDGKAIRKSSNRSLQRS